MKSRLSLVLATSSLIWTAAIAGPKIRDCNDAEQKQCDAELCTRNKHDCDEYHSTRVSFCRRARQLCDGPVKTEEKICTLQDMGQPVRYVSTAGVCSIDDSVDLPKYGSGDETISFVVNLVRSSAVSQGHHDDLVQTLRFTCDHLSTHGASGYTEKVRNTEGLIHWGRGKAIYGMTHDRAVFDGLVKTAKQACAQEQRAFGLETIFESEKSKNALDPRSLI
ncbi:hypothetical protein P170DRAFT_429045 [Aspergillus steynii IBT 23096]|uniref:Uncharacterized protein n=1 Tax=Aspergillus steynii IBT 23096 TaxID=1392250 RepID=A0A2I2FZ13_9EURO|nr:uncharacterized protein P170DRAFT_429045 [Aspergillus steynii IBT 23096]PLB45868.1 hypothetical protein P170DRAFT_429045 [Aspergillus steynii IBT 23096]